jgi:predicted phosphodiesterase
MTIAFDLISDLHIETWPSFDWTGLATSAYCVVAGDIARDRKTVIDTLKHLGRCYQAVFYVDGNDEHRHYYENLSDSYSELAERIRRIPNVVYLQDNVVVLDGVAILGTNGWWTYDLDPGIDAEQTSLWFQDRCLVTPTCAKAVGRMATTDATYMVKSVKRMQTHNDVKKIICVTHTVPDSRLIAHDIGLSGSTRFNTMGNSFMMQALSADTENKMHTWCFGHYHNSVDQVRQGVRFVNNCRGRGDTEYRKYVYHPLRIEVEV